MSSNIIVNLIMKPEPSFLQFKDINSDMTSLATTSDLPNLSSKYFQISSAESDNVEMLSSIDFGRAWHKR